MMHGGLCKGLRKNLRHWFESRGDGALPDFLVIGCMRCGTTAMTEALARHSQLVLIRGGRGNFFVNDEKYSRGIDWYKQGFPGIKERQRKEKTLDQPCLAYETAPGYIFTQKAVERIAATFPGVRCIALLRNPVDRAWSHYVKIVARAASSNNLVPISQEDLQKHLIKELSKFSGDPNSTRLLGRGLYGEQVKRWHEHMGRDNLLLLRSEDFYLNSQQVMDEVQEFLGIKREILPVEKIHSSPYVEGGGGGLPRKSPIGSGRFWRRTCSCWNQWPDGNGTGGEAVWRQCGSRGSSPASRRSDPGGPGAGHAVAGISDRTAMELVVKRSGANAGRGAPPPQVADWIREVLAQDMRLLESVTGRQWNWW